MARKFMELALTPSVKEAQDRYYGRHLELEAGAPADALGPDERAFIETRDSFYMSTVNEDGWPYLQHRGGPAGFLKVLSPSQIGFADLKGNRQLLSVGNLSRDDRVALFLMDYPAKARMKLLGRVRVVSREEDPELVAGLAMPGLERRAERAMLIDVVGFDWNCPAYITPRFTEAQIAPVAEKLHERIAELEAEVARLRQAAG